MTAAVAAGAPASGHLLIVQIGPVQEFIAQARRTRDLWFGSHLLSELSRAAAKAGAEHGALIFPALAADDPELAPCDGIVRGEAPPLSIANKIVVELRPEVEPSAAARAIRQAVEKRWRGIADVVRRDYEFDLAENIGAIWDEQIGSLVELVAAWAPLDRDYAAVRHDVEAALGGRRRLRDFAAIRHHRSGAPASSLDGGRVSVLADPQTRRARRAERRLLLGDNESLDAVGVVKRRGGNPDQFLSVVHVAATPWLQRVAARPDVAPRLAELRRACAALRVTDDKSNVERSLDRISRPNLTAAQLFPYNASVLYASRLPAVFEELGATEAGAREVARAWGDAHLRPLIDAAGREPDAYVACLVADGDRMGLAIDGLHSADAHRALTAGLGRFPAEAHRIVEQDHDGIVVYAGGDDVLAFLPVARAVACADALRVAFAAAVGPALDNARAIDRVGGHAPPRGHDEDAVPTPSLSVGVGIGHIHDSLGHLRHLGRRAEHAAKAATAAKLERNSLAVLVDRRSGGEHLWSASWDSEPARQLAADVGLVRSTGGDPARLPMGKVHELARLLRTLSAPSATPVAERGHRPATLESDAGGKVLRGEVTRILARIHRGSDSAPRADDDAADGGQGGREGQPRGLTAVDVGLELEEAASFTELHGRLADWVARMQIAHALAVSEPGTEDPTR